MYIVITKENWIASITVLCRNRDCKIALSHKNRDFVLCQISVSHLYMSFFKSLICVYICLVRLSCHLSALPCHPTVLYLKPYVTVPEPESFPVIFLLLPELHREAQANMLPTAKLYLVHTTVFYHYLITGGLMWFWAYIYVG